MPAKRSHILIHNYSNGCRNTYFEIYHGSPVQPEYVNKWLIRHKFPGMQKIREKKGATVYIMHDLMTYEQRSKFKQEIHAHYGLSYYKYRERPVKKGRVPIPEIISGFSGNLVAGEPLRFK